MSDLNDINRSIGSLEAKVESLTDAVRSLTGVVDGLQKTKWTTKGIIAGLTLAGGALGGKLAAFFGGLPPSQHP
jgi:hypothetical protein